jgi:hypothetical protein
VSFLVSLLLPVIATLLFFRGYPERAARGEAPAQLTTAAAIGMGARTGAAALVFLGLLGVVILAYRGKTVTPAGIEVSAVAFWATQFLLAAAIGAGVGALAALALLPWVRERLARSVPSPPSPPPPPGP